MESLESPRLTAYILESHRKADRYAFQKVASRFMGKFTTLSDVMLTEPPTDSPALELWHAGVKGFGVRIMRPIVLPPDKPGGKPRRLVRRAWLARYQVEDEHGRKRDKKEVLGLLERIEPSDTVLTLDDAMLEAQRRRAVMRPAAGTAKRWTVARAYDEMLASMRGLAPATLEAEREIRRVYFAPFEHRYLDELDERWWAREFVHRLQDGTFESKDKAGNTVRRRLSDTRLRVVMVSAAKLYTLASKNNALRGAVSKGENPAREAARELRSPTKRKDAVPLARFGDWWAALDVVGSKVARDVARVAVLTGLRKELLLSLRWSQVDLEQGTLRFDPLQHGTKRHRKRDSGREPIVLPVSQQVLQLLRVRRRADHSGAFVFASPMKPSAHVVDVSETLQAVERACGVPARLHDLRRTFASLANAAGADPVAVGRLMMHSNAQIALDMSARGAGVSVMTLDYTQTELAVLRKAAQAVADFATALVTPHDAPPAAQEAAQ